MLKQTQFPSPVSHFRTQAFEQGALYYAPALLRERIAVFQNGFHGLLTYAVKSNPDRHVLSEMIAAGVKGFDVASPHEIALMRGLAPNLQLHYNNPIRTRDEIAFALAHEVRSYSVDCMQELRKIAEMTPVELIGAVEISVRIKLDMGGSAYNFGSKFGADALDAIALLKEVAALGFIASITFHVGTQTRSVENYHLYIEEAARIARFAGVELRRLNVGGGFPSARGGETPNLQSYFDTIHNAMEVFDVKPDLVCEPGRALVADSMDYAVRIKSIEHGKWLFLTDGIYGGLSEMNLVSPLPHVEVYAPNGEKRIGKPCEMKAYGPTCDSIDAINELLPLPADVQEGDVVIFKGLGAYCNGPHTRFNGYGDWQMVEVETL